MKKQIVLAGLILASLALPALAIPCHPRVNEVNARRGWQRERIQQGLRNGSLTKCEARSLRQEGRFIHAQEQAMRARDGGHLTRRDQRVLNTELNQRSHDIYQEKHD